MDRRHIMQRRHTRIDTSMHRRLAVNRRVQSWRRREMFEDSEK